MNPKPQKIYEYIEKITHPTLKALLLKHLNPNANECFELFSKNYENDRKRPDISRVLSDEGLPYLMPLCLAFTYAPTPVCEEIADLILDSDENAQFLLLSEISRHYDKRQEEYPLEVLMFNAPITVRHKIVSIIKNWPSANIKTLLFTSIDFNEVHRFLNFKDPIASHKLMQAMAQIETRQLVLAIQHESDYFAIYNCAIYFFKSNNLPEIIALDFLDIMEKLDKNLIKNLFFGGSEGFFFEGSHQNLLHAGFKHKSRVVIKKLLDLFFRLDEKDRIKLLSHTAEYKLWPKKPSEFSYNRALNPLDAIFIVYENKAVSDLIINELAPYPELFSLLTKVALSKFRSSLHYAASREDTKALIAYLEHPNTTLMHYCYRKKKTILDSVKKYNLTRVSTINHALPILRLIQNKSLSAKQKKKKLSLLIPVIEQYPEVLDVCFSGEKTLLHHAAAADDALTTNFLLLQGIDPNREDSNKETPLDIAITTAQFDAIKVLTAHQQTNLKSDNNTDKLLPLVLQQNDCALTNSVLTNLRANSDCDIDQLFSTGLMQLPIINRTIDTLQQALKKTTISGSLRESLTACCLNTNDTNNLFLLHAGEVVSSSEPQKLQQASFQWVENQLTTLTSDNATLNKDYAQMQLLIFLFAMTPAAMVSFLKQIPLNSQLFTQLDLVLCHGLVQPLIFSRLTLAENDLIHTAFTHPKDSLNSIAHLHFRHSNLTLLPAELLQKFANVLSENELYLHSKNRLNPSIIVLTLERLYANEPIDNEKVEELIIKLNKELALFNQEPSTLSNDELCLMLNLTTAPTIKTIIQTFILQQNDTAPIHSKIETLFRNFRKDQPLINQGLLRELYFDLANHPVKMRKGTNQAALIDLIAIATSDEVHKIITSQQQALLPHLLTDALLATATTTNSVTPTNHQLPQWLYSLGNRTARISLTPFVDVASQFVEETRNLANRLNDYEISLKHTLPSLEKALNELVNQLIKNQFADKPPAWTSDIEATCHNLQEACDIATNALENVSIGNDIPQFHELHTRVVTLLSERGVQALPLAIKQICSAMDTAQEAENASIQGIIDLLPLQTILHLQDEPENESLLAEANLSKAIALKQTILNLNESLTKGILANPAKEQLLPLLTHWQMSNGYLAPLTPLLQQLTPLIPKLKPETLAEIIQQQDLILELSAKNAPLLTILRRLNCHELCMSDLLNVLAAADKESLALFIALTEKAQLHDLQRVSQYVLTGLNHDWDTYLLKDIFIDVNVKHVSSWLNKSLTSLSDFVTNALSIKAILIGVYCDEESCETRLNAFSNLIKQHKNPLTCEAINLFVSTYQAVLANDLHSKFSQAFVIAFNELMQQSSVRLQAEVLGRLTPKFVNQLLEHCLSGATSDEPIRASACKALLTRLCQQTGNESQTQLIKKRLGQQDIELLNDEHLAALAKSVLTEKIGLDDLTFDGVWIQRLLVSPRFIAACSVDNLQRLAIRYRALSLTLKQDEFERLNGWISGKLSFNEQHKEAWLRLQQDMLASPERKNQLLAKRERLLSFRADDSVRALFNQLEDNCFSLRESNPEMANRALNTMYTHHNQQLTTLRSDLLFRMADFVYTRAMQGKGDIPKAQSSLLSWLEEHLPHHNFEQAELARKTQVTLYSDSGQKIGYLDESNHALRLINDEPVSLLEVEGIQEGHVFYDSNRQRIGVLTQTGHLKRENLFQRHTSALLLGKMPQAQLEQSPAALDLLIQDVFVENSLDTLYLESENHEKSDWLQQEVTKRLSRSEKLVPKELFNTFVAQHPIESIITVLSHSANSHNSLALFSSLLANDDKREALFSHKFPTEIDQFLDSSEANKTLADYLINHHNKPWFADGLALFAEYSQRKSHKNLLNDALQHIASCVVNQNLHETTYDAVIKILIGSNKVSNLVLNGFLADDNRLSVQQARNNERDRFTYFFDKHHLVLAIKQLNIQPEWKNSAQHRLLLTILNAEHKRLFPATELRLSEKYAWHADELKQLSAFVNRHRTTQVNHDENNAISKRLLGELVFRCANFSQTNLFYNQTGTLNTDLLKSHLERGLLASIASRFYLVKKTKEAIKKGYKSIKSWFLDEENNEQSDIIAELKENGAIIDWKALSKESWGLSDSNKLPILVAFLMNYCGAKAPLVALLTDTLTHPELVGENIKHDVAFLMARYPHRNVSHVIFEVLESIAVNQPGFIDNVILKHMAHFHARTHLEIQGPLEFPQAELALITHFGQQKHYALTQHSASLLRNRCRDEVSQETCRRAATEAKVEGQLRGHKDSWYFRMWSAIKRWWHYGWSGMKNPSGVVKFCDDESGYRDPKNSPNYIKTSVRGGQSFSAQLTFTKKMKSLKERYHAFFDKKNRQHTSTSEPTDTSVSRTKLGIFANNTSKEFKASFDQTHSTLDKTIT